MVYGTRVCPGWYQGAPRPARGRREREVVFGMLMVDTEHPTSNIQHPTSNGPDKPTPGNSRKHKVESRNRGGRTHKPTKATVWQKLKG
jgi:hypothetical protein